MLFASIERKDDRVVPRTIFHQNFNGLEIILAEIESIIISFRVARWYTFFPEISIWVYFVGPWHLVYFTAIWYFLRPFGIFYGHLVFLRPFGIVLPFWYIVPIKIWQPCNF
jgi:hypothetical protein